MTNNERIDEMVKMFQDVNEISQLETIIDRHFRSDDYKTKNILDLVNEVAKDIINAGYHKTIWHKVADGDLPKEYHEVRFVSGTGYHHNGVYVKATNAFYKDGDIKYNIDEVIAWAELPKYKE